MPVLLIKAVDHSHPDPVIDRQHCEKRGMVVSHYPDGYVFGSKMGLPNFVQLQVDLDDEELAALLAGQYEDDNGLPQGIPAAEGIVPVLYRIRAYRVDIDNLPASVRTGLSNNGLSTALGAQLRPHLKRIRDNSVFTNPSKGASK